MHQLAHQKRIKFGLIGAGQIGGTIAHLLSLRHDCDIVLFDISQGSAEGKSLDLMHASAILGSSAHILGTSNYEEISNSDVIIVTAGSPRKPGMSRDDLVKINSNVIKTVAEKVSKYATNAFVIIVTNPLDMMVQLFQKTSKIPSNRVVGMSGVLDGGRLRYLLSQLLHVSPNDINTFVIGAHGDTMVPVISNTTISGIPLMDFVKSGRIKQSDIDHAIDKTKNGGAEIVKLLGNGSAYYSPAIGSVTMAESYIFDQKRLFSAATKLNGEYGFNDLYVGAPVIIGNGGVEKVIELNLNAYEKELLSKSVRAIEELYKLI